MIFDVINPSDAYTIEADDFEVAAVATEEPLDGGSGVMSEKVQGRLPVEVDRVRAAFPADVSDLLPEWEHIPESFRHERDPWSRIVHEWFFLGLDGRFIPKPGIDLSMAMRHLDVCLRSFEPKHEHEIAGVAYLCSLWFERFEPGRS